MSQVWSPHCFPTFLCNCFRFHIASVSHMRHTDVMQYATAVSMTTEHCKCTSDHRTCARDIGLNSQGSFAQISLICHCLAVTQECCTVKRCCAARADLRMLFLQAPLLTLHCHLLRCLHSRQPGGATHCCVAVWCENAALGGHSLLCLARC